MPVPSAILLLAMQSVVAGMSEEAAFRGYMQGQLERRYGVLAGILVSGLAFGLLHFGNHAGEVLGMLPYYLAVSAVYGGLTWAADSILPAVVLHALGDTVVLIRWWATGRPEWQLTSAPPPLVWDRGLDATFVANAVVLVVLGWVAVWAYRKLHDWRMGLTASRARS